MRLVKVKGPEVARVAFGVGISRVSLHREQVLSSDGRNETKDAVDIDTSTPKAKAFIDALMSAPFFDAQEYTISVRQPRSVVSHEGAREVTWPLVEPTADIFEELWQFSHVTYGFVGRVLIAAMLLAYGLIEYKILFIIAGLLFLPLLPLLLAASFGLWTRQWRLAGQGVFALAVATALLIAGGVLVALLTNPPLKFNEHNSLLTGALISLGVGVAAALATGDDVGRREMIGLAATAQLAIVPVWFGVSFVFGFPALDSASPAERAAGFGLNVGTVVLAASTTYALLRMRGEAVRRFTDSAG
ncbi:MAG: hypothetical protein ACRD9R_04990 [Pyrinomonadaceae bacterium]